MHEQHTLFKNCVHSFNGAITSANLEEYLKQDILAQTTGNDFYANRRKIKVDHFIGGDPVLTNATLWELSLSANPALLKIEHYTPWYEVPMINAAVKENLRRIIQQRTNEADLVRAYDDAVLNQKLLNQNLAPKKAYIGLLNGATCFITGPVMLGSVTKCVNGCATPISINSTTDFMENRQLAYFRDSETGFVRARIRIDAREFFKNAIGRQDNFLLVFLETALDGSRIHIGCSSISTPMLSTQSVHICVKCELINSFDSQCLCVCPQYPSPTDTTSTASTP